MSNDLCIFVWRSFKQKHQHFLPMGRSTKVKQGEDLTTATWWGDPANCEFHFKTCDFELLLENGDIKGI